MEPFDKTFNELRKSEGLTFAASYTLLDQYATVTPEGVRHNWATGRFDLTGGWKAYDHGTNAGSFSLLARSGVNLGVSQQFNLSDSLGSGLVLNCLPGGGPQLPITLNVLYYRQDFYKRKMAFYIGKIHPNEFISLSLYNNDERSQFLNAENDGNLTIPSDGCPSKCGDAGEGFAFEEFEAGSAAGGDVGDLVGDAGLWMAETESPPPTMVVASSLRATAWAMALVPWAKAGISKTPMGPFQMMVRASAISPAKRAMDLGPMSSAMRSAGKVRCRRRLWFGVGGELVGEDVVDGQEEADAFGLGFFEGGFGDVDLVGFDEGLAGGLALRVEEGVGHASADDDGVGLVEQVVDDPILSETLAPPMMATKGLSGSVRALPR
jgi:hypothetical protein